MNTTGGISIDGGPELPGTLTTEIEMIEVGMARATKPDPSWELVDILGHFHAYDEDGKLPTLVARTRHADCDGMHVAGFDQDPDTCEGYDVTEHFCAICDEQIKPGSIDDSGPRQIPGRTSWWAEITASRPIKGTVSVRMVSGGRVLFGVAEARVVSGEGGSDGMRLTSRLDGASPLGVREVVPPAGIAEHLDRLDTRRR